MLTGAYVVVLRFRMPWGASMILGFFGALGLTIIAGGFKQLVASWGKAKAIRRALEGVPFQDGKLAVAIGPIRPEGHPLKAPISDEECVVYEFEAFRSQGFRQGSVEKNKEMLFTGMAMCPSSVSTLQGRIRLMGFPTLENIFKKPFIGTQYGEIFKAYAARVTFKDMKGGKQLGAMVSGLENVLVDDDGTVREDWQFKDAPPLAEPWEGIEYTEKTVPVGEKVVILGQFSAARGGLVNDVGLAGSMIELYPGTPEAVGKKIRGNAIYMTLFGVAFFAISHGIMAFAWFAANK